MWSSQETGGLCGCHAARPFPGGPQDLEVPLETLLQPQQAGKVSGYTARNRRGTDKQRSDSEHHLITLQKQQDVDKL